MNVLEAIRNRRSVRAYSTRAIPAEVMQRVRRAIRYAPSACNFQPWRFIFVEQEALRTKLAEDCDKAWMAHAPVTVVGCGFSQQAYKKMGGHDNSIDMDLAIALDHLTLAAVAEGLGTCWIGAFSEEKVRKLLNIPPDVKVVAMTPLGFPATPDLNSPIDEIRRKPESDIFRIDTFDGRWV